MSWPNLKPPFRINPTLEPTVAERKAKIKRFGARLMISEWLTTPSDPFMNLSGFNLALYPLVPRVRWYWHLANRELYQSDALVFVGFPAGTLPAFASAP